MLSKNFGIFCVAIMMVHLAATQDISTLPDNIGSCQPIKAYEVEMMVTNLSNNFSSTGVYSGGS